MRNKLGNLLWGIAFILAGVIIAGNAFDLWNISIFFEGWWTLFIIVPCIISIIQNGFNTGNSIGTTVGILLLLSAQGMISRQVIGKLIFPLILVIIGLSIVFGGMFRRIPNIITASNSEGKSDYSAIFSGNEVNLAGQRYSGGNISAIFGGVDLNLKNAIITEDIVISPTVIFGGADIIVPSNVKVKVSSVPIFGGVSNKSVSNFAESAPTLYINATCIFGGVEVK